MKKKDLRIGVVGTGMRGKIAAYAHDPGRGSRIVAAADPDPEALQNFAESLVFPIRQFSNYRKLIQADLCNAVLIYSPDYLHEKQALAFLEAGISVYLEKPMALDIDGCDRILETARRTGTKLFVGHNMRHMTFVRIMKRLIDEGAIGDVKTAWCRHFVGRGGDNYFKDWHAERKKSMGLLLQKAIHDIDVLHWLCGGSPPRRVNAMGGLTVYGQIKDRRSKNEPADATPREENWPPLRQKKLNPVIDVEDLSMMQMELENGCIAAYQQCHFTPDHWRNFTVIGTGGRLENIGDGTSPTEIRVWNRRRDTYSPPDIVYPIPEIDPSRHYHDENIMQEFIDFVSNDGPVSLSPLDARHSVAACFLATRSLRHGGKVQDVPPLSQDLIDFFRDRYRILQGSL